MPRRRRNRYPATVRECIDDVKYRRGVIALVRRYDRGGMYGPRWLERAGGLVRGLCRIYPIGQSIRVRRTRGGSRCAHAIIYLHKPSMLTLLHEFAHAKGCRTERAACRWSINLFRRACPARYAACTHRRHLLIAE